MSGQTKTKVLPIDIRGLKINREADVRSVLQIQDGKLSITFLPDRIVFYCLVIKTFQRL